MFHGYKGILSPNNSQYGQGFVPLFYPLYTRIFTQSLLTYSLLQTTIDDES